MRRLAFIVVVIIGGLLAALASPWLWVTLGPFARLGGVLVCALLLGFWIAGSYHTRKEWWPR